MVSIVSNCTKRTSIQNMLCVRQLAKAQANSSTFRDNSEHSWDESLSKSINSTQFNNILGLAATTEQTAYNPASECLSL